MALHKIMELQFTSILCFSAIRESNTEHYYLVCFQASEKNCLKISQNFPSQGKTPILESFERNCRLYDEDIFG